MTTEENITEIFGVPPGELSDIVLAVQLQRQINDKLDLDRHYLEYALKWGIDERKPPLRQRLRRAWRIIRWS